MMAPRTYVFFFFFFFFSFLLYSPPLVRLRSDLAGPAFSVCLTEKPGPETVAASALSVRGIRPALELRPLPEDDGL
jgi:hypothetical protein